MFKAQIEHIKSNSIAALQQNYAKKEQDIVNITRSMDRMDGNLIDFSKLTSSSTKLDTANITKQETVLE